MVDHKANDVEDAFFSGGDAPGDLADTDATIRHAPASGPAEGAPDAAPGNGGASPATHNEKPPASPRVVVSELNSGPQPSAPGPVASMSVDDDFAQPTPVAAGPGDSGLPKEAPPDSIELSMGMPPAPAALPPESIEVSMTMPPAPGPADDDLDIDMADPAPADGPAPAESIELSTHMPPAPGPVALEPAKPLTDPLPVLSASDDEREAPTDDEVARAQGRIDELVREARAHGNAPEAAPLWFEAGWAFENELGKLRDAAAHYEQAHNADPTFLPVIHATRRLFAHLGKWSMVVILLDKEIEVEGAPKASLFFEKARILETKLGKADEAVGIYKLALQEDAAYVPAVDALTRHDVGEDASAVVEMLERAVEATSEDSQKVSWLIELGRLSESHLQDDGKAIDCYTQARALDPTHMTALIALRRLYRRAGDDASFADVLDALARMARVPSEAVAFLFERAEVLTRLGQQEDAVAALEAAHGLVRDDTRVLNELIQLYKTLEQPQKLEAALVAQANASRDTSEKVALFEEAAELAENSLSAPDRSIEYYRQCVSLDPTYQPALAAVGRLFARAQRWQDIGRLYEIQLQTAQDDAERIPLLFKYAELLTDRLADEDKAIDQLSRVLELSPGYVPALKMVSSLYARKQRWGDLIAMYETELSGQDDRDQAIYLLEKIGSLYEKELADLDKAIDAYKRLLEKVPGYLPALRTLGRLYARTEQWDLLIAVNDEEAELIGDQNQIVALFHRNGEIFEHTGQLDDAVDAYRRALTLMPNYLPSLKALGALFSKNERYEDLVDMHRQEADVARHAEQRAQLLFRVATIYDDRLHDADKAAQAYREVLEEVPSFAPAIRALARISAATGDWDVLVDVLRRQQEGMQDPRDKAVLSVRISAILELNKRDLDAAMNELDAAIVACPTLLSAHEERVRLCERTQNARDEAKAREAMEQILEATERKITNQRALAELYLHRLEEPQASLEALERIIAMSPSDAPAHRTALKVSLKSRDYRAAIRHAEALARLESSASKVAHLWLQVAAWKESHLDPAEDPLESYVRVLQFDPQNPIALRAVERAYVERHCWDGLYKLYGQELAGVDVPSRRADLCMKMGELAERRLDDTEGAIAAYEMALDAAHDLLPALDRLKELYGKLGRAEDELKIAALEANASKDPAKAIATLLEVGALQRDKFNDAAAAIESFQKVLSREPANDVAFSAIEELHEQNGDHQGLVDLFLNRVGTLSEPELKVGLLTRVARIRLEALGDVEGAIGTFHGILDLAPKDVGVLRTCGDLHYERQEYEDAARCYRALVPELSDPAKVGLLQYRLGVIFSEHIPDAQRAINALSVACRSFSPTTEEYVDGGRRLARVYKATEKYDDARLVLSQLAQSATKVEDQLEFRVDLAELLETRFDDVKGAAGEVRKALDVASNEQKIELLNKVTDLYERAQDLEGYLDVASQQAERMMGDDRERAAQLYERCAKLTHEHLKDAERAIGFARQGLDIDDGNVSLRGFLADRLSEIPSRFVLAVEEHRRVLRTGSIRPASITALFQGWTTQRAHDRAFMASEVLDSLGLADDEANTFYSSNKKRVQLASDEVLDESGFNNWLVHPKNKNPIHEVLSVVAGELGKVNPDDLSAFKVERKDVLKGRSDDPLRKNADAIAKMFGGGLTYEVHRTRTQSGVVEAKHHHPPVLLVSANVANIHDDREQRFLLGRKIMALMSGHHLVQGKDANGLAEFISAVCKAVDKTFEPLLPGLNVDAQAKKISSALSRGAKRQLQDAVSTLDAQRARLKLDEFIEGMPLTQNRAGLVAANELRAAVNVIQSTAGIVVPKVRDARLEAFEKSPLLSDLVSYALSDDYFAARQTLRFAVDA